MTESQPSSLTIVICTFNRREMLAKTLQSIASLARPVDLQVNVLVVDNIEDSNALQTVGSFSRDFPFELTGIAAHPANIAVARNAGAAACTSEFVAFIDDDQEVEPDWLTAVADLVSTYPHDVFFGSVAPLFEAPERANPSLIRAFSRTVNGPTGLDLHAMGRRKTKGVALGSGNSVFRRDTTLLEAEPFDPAFGHSGGEDTEFFCRLQRKGKHFAWAPEVKALEFVPAARCDPAYLESRLFAGAQAFARSVSQHSPIPALERMKQRGIGAIQLALLLPKTLAALGGHDGRRTELRYKRALALGKISFAKLEPYRVAEKSH